MDAIELARRLAGLGQAKDACKAYALALEGATPEEKMEAALYILQSGGDYRIAYTCFQELHSQGHFRADCLSIMTQAFYEPNVKALKKRYEKNCRLLAKYPYIFRKDFVSYKDLPIRFYPYDDKGYLPFFVDEERFGDYINFKNSVVSRNFFKDLEKPILADSVFSQYELEYLNDNVRDSERVGRENHVYLHYPSWTVFCAYLQCWDLRPLLKSKKLVFLIGNETNLYPIDFKERFGIDYSQYVPQPVGIREVNRLIWHAQLSAHNGGDFFNEVFDSHPNLLAMTSVYMSAMETLVKEVKDALKKAKSLKEFLAEIDWRNPRIMTELYCLDNPSEKDIFIALYLGSRTITAETDQNARIAPVVFFQPHFENIANQIKKDDAGRIVFISESEKAIHQSKIFEGFSYIKTFMPMRRITNSYAASVRYMYLTSKKSESVPLTGGKTIVSDVILERVLNRSFLIDPEDRLYRDSVLVRFEDGKLNPKATFSALAAFLDLPCTESMTYCSENGRRDPHPSTKGFDPISVYRTYDVFANDTERYFIEYFMRDAYQAYGYDFLFYDGETVDEAKIEEMIKNFTAINKYIRATWRNITKAVQVDSTKREQAQNRLPDECIKRFDGERLEISRLLQQNLQFFNRTGQPLRMMPMLRLDPKLLEQPLYH